MITPFFMHKQVGQVEKTGRKEVALKRPQFPGGTHGAVVN